MITAFGLVPSIVMAINDGSMVGEARRAAIAFAGRLGFDETHRGRAGIVATEAATNLFKYAKAGEIILQGRQSGSVTTLELLSLDKGPGILDLDRCLADGYSTFGSPGNGLGAMIRLSSRFEIVSRVGQGTAILARLSCLEPAGDLKPRSSSQSGLAFDLHFEIGAVSVPVGGEEVCGDAWAIREIQGGCLVMVVDGLGHGPHAADAAREAVQVLRQSSWDGPAEVIREAHQALRNTRGAAMALARIDIHRGEVRYAGVGNIAASIFAAETEIEKDTAHGQEKEKEKENVSMISHNGIVGHTLRKVQEFVYPWKRDSLLVMHSDGLATHWRLNRIPGLIAKHPGLIAGILYRDVKRGRDDVTVVTVRQGKGSGTWS